MEHKASNELSDILGDVESAPAARVDRLYARFKADGSQTLDLQRDALLAAGVEPGHLYEDQASGKLDNQSGY